MLEQKTLKYLQDKKNLLAFSGGVDSTALFFLLQDFNINFDIAIVNYSVREQSKDEVEYAKNLAKKYNKECYIHNAKKITNNFEAKAREIRYNFFEEIIDEKNYENLITAHHLGDRFEWMLMQFCKGAGCIELAGMNGLEKKEKYNIVRPLLHLDKSELLAYLDENNTKYFVDESNFDTNIKRNKFRHQHTNPLLDEYLSGIKKSFLYLDSDKETLINKAKINTIDNLSYFKSSDTRSDIYNIDKHIKSLGHIITANERELLKVDNSVILGRKYLVVKHKDFVFITPYETTKEPIPKEYKELFRVLKIDSKLRVYLYKNKNIFEEIRTLLT